MKRLGAFKNPDFYKAQAMRLSTKGKPRIISTVEETTEYIGIPRGALSSIAGLFDNSGAKYHIADETTKGKALDVSFIGDNGIWENGHSCIFNCKQSSQHFNTGA